jgi:hypothetical protein
MRISNTFSVSEQKTLVELGVFWMLNGIGDGYLACRDILSEPITIPAGASITVSYTLKARSSG